ncbi:homocitrate synthase [Annulohypoxylon nitens]|nr:homocitrate synthase [Annulohypoxylon nitens]
MSTCSNPISHHTSHTMENGASNSNSGANWNAVNSDQSVLNQGHVLEASLTETDDAPFYRSADGTERKVTEFNGGTPSIDSTPLLAARSVSSNIDNVNIPTVGSYDLISSLNEPTPVPFKIVDTTLREGEQFSTASYSQEEKIEIARALDRFGVEYIELTNPVASIQSRVDAEVISKLGLRAKIVCHIRCNIYDARHAVESGVQGISMCIGTSKQLMEHSHGKDMAFINDEAQQVIEFVRSKGLEIRFTGEDTFRSNFDDILKMYTAFDRMGINRVGIADTVGGATPMDVYEKVEAVRKAVKCDIETHFHNDTGCAVANARIAVEAGATHVDTTVLGIGERNGITSLRGFMTAMAPAHGGYISRKYRMEDLDYLEALVARIVGIKVPFDNFARSGAVTASSYKSKVTTPAGTVALE